MPSGTSAYAQIERKKDFESRELPLVSAVTFEPLGNPLLKASEAQRRHFFDTLARSFKMPERQDGKGASFSSVVLEKQNRMEPGSPRASAHLYSEASWSDIPEFRHAQQSICRVIHDYARGDAAIALSAVHRLESRLQEQRFKSDDLMAVLLLAIEDMEWEDESEQEPTNAKHGAKGQAIVLAKNAIRKSGLEQGQGGAKGQAIVLAKNAVGNKAGGEAHPMEKEKPIVLAAIALEKNTNGQPLAETHDEPPKQFPLPKTLMEDARLSVQIRLASVREMLRYYFDKNPREYHRALSKVLRVDESLPEQSEQFQTALSRRLELIGSYALAQLVLEEIKSCHGMDTEECLLRLGYRYDSRLRRMIFGKRACGSRSQQKGILHSILCLMKGKKMASSQLPPPKKRSRLLSARPRKQAAPG